MNGAGLTPGSVAGSGASGGDRIMGAAESCKSMSFCIEVDDRQFEQLL